MEQVYLEQYADIVTSIDIISAVVITVLAVKIITN
jgi:hypothetical protein